MFVAKTLIVFVCVATMTSFTFAQVPGAPVTLSGEDLKSAESFLVESFELLAKGNGPSYSVSKVNSASRQIVSGSLYKYNSEIKDGDKVKVCDISIWSQPWLENGEEITFECENEAKAVHKFNRKH